MNWRAISERLFYDCPDWLSRLIFTVGSSTFARDPRKPYFHSVFRHVAEHGIDGDYLEFGSYRGRSLMMAYHCAQRVGLSRMRFVAFDCFGGLPESEGNKFEQGTMKCDLPTFLTGLRKAGVDLRRLVTVKGLYSGTLNPQTKLDHGVTKAAIVHIDCDLYSSARDVLAFVPGLLAPGSVLIFDDWHAYDSGPEGGEAFGERRAFAEWPLATRCEPFYDDGNAAAFLFDMRQEQIASANVTAA